MEQWYRLCLGRGADVYQSLREVRDLRYRVDPQVPPELLYITAIEIESGDTWVYFPPGNGLLAATCNAEPCQPPIFDGDTLVELASEEYPITASYPDHPDLPS